MKLYTKTGDKGTTGTMQGRMGKGEQLAVALGTIDELNSWIGYCRSQNNNKSFEKELVRVQENLLTIGSGLAGSGLKISGSEVTRLEKLIDKLSGELPKLSKFIFPYGPMHVARTVARRAERELVKALETTDVLTNKKVMLKYLNRLSDALFVLARKINFEYNTVEQTWQK
ncbi:MAG: cob(I)yrinic acid a,c-diamide adenosyltransferase [Patescibacteria group bacterium]